MRGQAAPLLGSLLLLGDSVDGAGEASGDLLDAHGDVAREAADETSDLSHELLAVGQVGVGLGLICREGLAIGDGTDERHLLELLGLLLDDLGGINGVLLIEDVGAGRDGPPESP